MDLTFSISGTDTLIRGTSDDPDVVKGLWLAVAYNGQGNSLAPVLSGSFEMLSHQRVPEEPLHQLLSDIIAACEDHPESTVSMTVTGMPTVTHIANLPVTVGEFTRQLCGWCGASLIGPYDVPWEALVQVTMDPGINAGGGARWGHFDTVLAPDSCATP